jgi:hypothetical protein
MKVPAIQVLVNVDFIISFIMLYCLFLNQTGNGMHYGSGSNIKWNKKVKKILSKRPTFWEIMLLLTLKRQDFVQILFCCKTVLNIVRIQNLNKNFSKVRMNHYGSTTLATCFSVSAPALLFLQF